jgi:ATP-dependent helicase HrpB
MTLQLPIIDVRQKIIDTLDKNNRLIIQAPTGSGKSTQIPQMLLDSHLFDGQILVLQPRRLAARMLATRVAEERGSILGQEVGFQTRFESSFSDCTRIRYITEGILPPLLFSDKSLKTISAVIFDEFHERSLTVDLGLALIRDLQMKFRADLKLIVMSATLSSSPLVQYLEGAQLIVSEGRTFPVSIRYYSEVARESPWIAAVEAIRYLIGQGIPGDLLIFMPGVYEINKTVQLLREKKIGEPLEILSLYGNMSSEMQQLVMKGATKRKVIVSTNIAETSLTIPGVRHVIDSGLARVNRYDNGRGFNTLYVEKISIDSADQRAGRAGREAPGNCIRLWSVADHRGRAQSTQPEIARVDLCEAILQLKLLGYKDIGKFCWFEAPEANSIKTAMEFLQSTGALTPGENLTAEGKLIAELPMHPRLARLLLEAHKRGILEQGALAAAVLTERPLFSGSVEFPQELIKQSAGSDFELIRLIIDRITKGNFNKDLCRKLNVNLTSLHQILRTQSYFLQVCRRMGLNSCGEFNDPLLLSQAILIAYSDRLARRRDRGTLQCDLASGRRGELDKRSAARNAEFIVATTISELKSKQQTTPRTMLSLACTIEKQWLTDYFAEKFISSDELVWNSTGRAVESIRRSSCCGVVIEESVEVNPDPEKAGEVLARIIIDKKMPLNGWNSEAVEYMNRLQWLSETFPEKALPVFGDDEKMLIVYELCKGQCRYDAVKDKSVIGIIKGLLSYDQQRMIESLAPSHIINPAGKKLPVTYRAGKKPVIRARIQELFDFKTTPRIADKRVAVILEILAPNMRPVQITDDLEGFWKNHYPELKKTLSRRYPKHQWC